MGSAVRTVTMPDFVAEELSEYIELEGYEEGERIFPFGKLYLYHEMDRGCKASGVKRIRVHDLRHSHVSLLIERRPAVSPHPRQLMWCFSSARFSERSIIAMLSKRTGMST